MKDFIFCNPGAQQCLDIFTQLGREARWGLAAFPAPDVMKQQIYNSTSEKGKAIYHSRAFCIALALTCLLNHISVNNPTLD